MTLLIQPTVIAEWQALLIEAQQQAAIPLLEDIESYLVFLLMRFSQQPQISNSILGLEFLQSLDNPQERYKHQLIADKCLLFAGLFPERAQKYHVNLRYFVHLGQTAYGLLAEEQVKARHIHALYQLLASEFIHMMDVLHAIRDLNPTQNQNLLLSFESWQTLGSTYAFRKISQATHGNIPSETHFDAKLHKPQ